MSTIQGIIFSILIALGVVQMTPPVQEPILGADSTINRLELWTATTAPYAAITPRTYGRSLYLPTGSVTATYGYFTNLFVDTCTGTGCGSGSGSDDLADVTNRGASATATLQLYGGFLSSSSTVTSTFTVVGQSRLPTVSSTQVTTTELWTRSIISRSDITVTSTGNVDLQAHRDTGYINGDAADIYFTAYNGDIIFDAASVIQFNGPGTNVLFDSTNFTPQSNNSLILGSNSASWSGLYVSSTAFFGGPLIPRIGATPTLGSPTSSWGSVYASGTSQLQFVLFTNATGSQVTSTSLYVSGSASATRLFANSATIGTATLGTSTVEGKGICLSDGSYCSPSGSEADTLATVTGRGSSTIQTLNLMGGFIAASSSVTSTFNVTGATTLANATATSLFVTTLQGTSSTITTMAATSLFADQVTSTALFSTSLRATSGTITTLAAGALFFGNGTSTNFYAAGTASSTKLFANMATLGGLVVSSTTVCLSNGVGCLAASASAAGIVELATIAETSAGSDATRAVTPDGLAGSVFGSKTVELYLTTSSGAFLAVNSASNTSTCFTVQPPLAGMVLTAAHVAHGVAGSGTTSTVVNIKTTSSLFLLSTPLYIDPGEYGSETAVTSSVINTSNDDVWAYERLCADVQNVENTTPGKETILSLTFSLP